MATDISSLKTKLEAAGQSQVLRFWDDLDAAGREKLAGAACRR